MTKEEAKKLLPILQAYIDGKQVQTKIKTGSKRSDETWVNIKSFDIPGCFRIKPKDTYRSFKNADECWQEMQKHQPFGWLKSKGSSDNINYYHCCAINKHFEFATKFTDYTFADGAPFGIKE